MREAHVRTAMAKQTTDQLRIVCTDDAPEYSAEAIQIARAELERRGVDTSSLVARTGHARDAVPTPIRRAGSLYAAALVVNVILAVIFRNPTTPIATLAFGATRIVALVGFIGLFRERFARSKAERETDRPRS